MSYQDSKYALFRVTFLYRAFHLVYLYFHSIYLSYIMKCTKKNLPSPPSVLVKAIHKRSRSTRDRNQSRAKELRRRTSYRD